MSSLEHGMRAVVLGIKSFGKGSVQTVIPIEDHGAIRLTTARYYTPSGVSIQAKGIVPDIEVAQAKVETLKANANFSEESLPGHLINDQSKEDEKPNMPANDNKKGKKDDKKDSKKDDKKDDDAATKDKDAAADYQLSRALDLIRAVSIYQRLGDSAPAAAQPQPAPFAPAAGSKPTTPTKK